MCTLDQERGGRSSLLEFGVVIFWSLGSRGRKRRMYVRRPSHMMGPNDGNGPFTSPFDVYKATQGRKNGALDFARDVSPK